MSRIQKTDLSSGIRLITEEMPDVESSTIGIWVTTGSRNETPKTNGVSHFIEHLLFKGTERRTSLDISREIESVGGVLNAFTAREYTCFFAKVLNKDLPKAVDLLSDILLNSKFDEKELEKERMVVLQEIKMVEDTPDDLIHDLFAERFWPEHSLGWSILGSSASIKSMTREEILGYFRSHYHSGNVFVTAAGGVKHKALIKILEGSLGHVSKKGAKYASKTPKHSPGLKLVKKDLEQVHLCLGLPVTPQPDPGRYKVYLMNTILGGGMSSRLFQEVREKRGLAYAVYTYINLCKDAGSMIAYAGTSEAAFPEVAGLIVKELERFHETVTVEELSSAKEQLKGGMLLGLETSDNRMMKLARDEMYFGRTVTTREIVKGIDGVTIEDMRKTAETLLDPGRMTLVAIGKVRKKGLPAAFKEAK